MEIINRLIVDFLKLIIGMRKYLNKSFNFLSFNKFLYRIIYLKEIFFKN